MKMRELIRRSCYVAAVMVLSFGPGAFAKTTASSSSTAVLTRGTGAFVLRPFVDERKKRKKMAASEGGSAALYLALAGLACGGAVLVRSRRAEKAV